MPLYRIGAKIVLFIHIPKTGGTSIARCLENVSAEALAMTTAIGDLPCPPQHFQASILNKLVPADFVDYAFCLVRHPVDRLVSEFFYISKIKGRIKLGLTARNLDFATATNDQLAQAFTRWVRRSFQNFHKDPYTRNNHIRPQVDFLGYDGAHTFRFEDGLALPIRHISEMLNVELPEIGCENASQRQTFPIEPKTLAAIHDFYSSDFRELGYK